MMTWMMFGSARLLFCPLPNRLVFSDTSGITFTAMMKSAPICRRTLTGTGFTSPPSDRYLFLHLTTVNIAGREILALTASSTGPLSNTTSSPVSISVATQAKGISRSANFMSPPIFDFRNSLSLLPLIKPFLDRDGSIKGFNLLRLMSRNMRFILPASMPPA